MRKKYPTDLSKREWFRIEKHFMVSYKKGGKPPKYSKCKILNAIFMYCAQDVNGAIYYTIFRSGRLHMNSLEDEKKQGVFERMNYDITKYSRSKMGS